MHFYKYNYKHKNDYKTYLQTDMKVKLIQIKDTCTMNVIIIFQVKHIQQNLRLKYFK